MLPSVGMFRQSVLESWALLRSLELADFRNPSPASDVRIVRAARATNTHRDEYDVYVNAAAYDFMLSDGAIMLFRRDSDNKTELSYQYYANPYDALSLHAFALEMGAVTPIGATTLEEAYELYRDQVSVRSADLLTLRYDWSPKLYRVGAHPAGHFHVGFRTEMRLAVDSVLLPHQFTHFVLRQYYTSAWEDRALHIPKVVRRAQRRGAAKIPESFLTELDLCELRLG